MIYTLERLLYSALSVSLSSSTSSGVVVCVHNKKKKKNTRLKIEETSDENETGDPAMLLLFDLILVAV